MDTQRPVGRRSIPFGWWVLGAAIGLQALFGGLLHTAFGAYVVPIQEEFGWSRTTLAAAYSLQQVESGVFGPLLGFLIGRYGPRAVVRIGLLVAAGGFVLFSRVDSLPTFYISFLILSIGAYFAGYLSMATAVVNWFENRTSTAIGLMSAGMSTGGLLAPVLALSLTNNGWRGTAFASALMLLFLGLPLSQVLRLKKPVPSVGTTPGSSSGAPPADDYTAREALRTSAFWYIAVGHTAGAFLFSALAVHLISAVTAGFGVPLEVAALASSLVTGSTLIGQVVGGAVGDRYNKRLICIGCMVFMMVGMVLLAFAEAPWMVVLFALIYGISLGTRGPLMVALRAEYFGKTAFASILGMSMSVATGGTILGPLMVGWLADTFGSYRPGFTILAIIAGLGSFCFYLAKPPVRERRMNPSS